jgi:hypothetical protein
VNPGFAQFHAGVIVEAAMILAEVPERIGVQVPFMGGIAEGRKIRVVRRGEEEGAPRFCQPVKLLHGTHHVGDVFDNVGGVHMIEGAVFERIREDVDIAEHVGTAGGVAVDSNGARQFIDPASDIEHSSGWSVSVHVLLEYPTFKSPPCSVLSCNRNKTVKKRRGVSISAWHWRVKQKVK